MNTIYIFENTNSLHVKEALTTMYEIFSEKYDVKFCLNYRAMDTVRDNKCVIDNCISLDSYLKAIRFFRRINKDDIVIYPTITVRNIFILFVLRLFVFNNIYYIRNSNSWLKYSYHQNNIFYRILSNATTFLKKYLIKKSFQIFVANNNLKTYLETQGVNKTINVVPYKFFDEANANPVSYDNKLQFVIPGNIDLLKKDFNLIRDAINCLSTEDRKKITIILLGKPANKSDHEFCLQWRDEIGDALFFYTSFVPDKEFTKVMAGCHFVLGILNINYQDRYNSETYGVSKDTGVDAQAIAYGKPLIINSDFCVVDEVKSSSIGFDDATQLAGIIRALIHEDDYSEISEKALINCRKLSLDCVTKKLHNL